MIISYKMLVYYVFKMVLCVPEYAHFAEAQKSEEVFGFSRGGILRHGPHWFGILSIRICEDIGWNISWP